MNLSSAFEIIDPADPENIRYDGDGVYTASWSPVNPHAADVEIIKRTPGIIIVKELHPHPVLDGWVCLSFRIDRSEIEAASGK